MTKDISKQMIDTGDKIAKAGKDMTKYLTLPIIGVGAAGLKVAADFDEGMSKVKAIAGATQEQFEALREEAIKLGEDTSFSSTEVANAMTEMAKAGWDAQQIIAGMEGVLSAAAASGEELAVVSTIVADAITGFRLEAEGTVRVADLLTQAANSGTIDIRDLGETFKYVAPVAGTMGLSIEEVTTAIAAMSKAGIKGSQAGTSLRATLTRMAGQSKPVATAMDALGVSMTNADGSIKSLDTIIRDLRYSFKDLTEEEKVFRATQIAGTDAMAGLVAILNLSQEEYDEISKSMKNASGVAKETADIMKDNLKGRLEELKGSLESLAIKTADLLLPTIEKFVDKLIDLVNKFSEMDDKQKKAILIIAGLVAAFGPLVWITGKVTSGIGSFISLAGKIPTVAGMLSKGIGSIKMSFLNFKEALALANAGFPGLAAQSSSLYGVFAKLAPTAAAAGGSMTSAVGAIAAAAAPIAAVVAAIALLVGAFVTLWKTNEEFRDKMTKIWNEVKATFERLTSGIVEKINDLGFNFKDFKDLVTTIWKEFCDFLAPIFEYVWGQISNTFDVVTDVILGLLDIFIGIFTGDWEQAWDGVKQIFSGVWDFIKDTAENMFNSLKDLGSEILSWFGTTWDELWQNIKDGINNAIDSVINFFKELPYNIGYYLGLVIGKAIKFVVEFPEKAKQAGRDFINKFVEFFVTLPDKIKMYFDLAVAKARQWAFEMKVRAKEAASDFITSFVDFFKSIPDKIKSIGENIVKGIWNGITGMDSWLSTKFPEFVDGFFDGLKDAFGIHSPSTLAAKIIGKWLPPGISTGFMKALPGAVKSMKKGLEKEMLKMQSSDVFDLMFFPDMDSMSYDYVFGKSKKNKTMSSDRYKESDNQKGGDTYNFYSPKPIDEVEAARQLKKTKRDLLEGF